MKKGIRILIYMVVAILTIAVVLIVNAFRVVIQPGMTFDKPVIYLYPEETRDVTVKLDYTGDLLCTYPDYNDGWSVVANTDGTLINKEDGLEYSYLFWDGLDKTTDWDMSEGFVVKGEDTKEFLQTTLKEMGLTPKEYNEFIVFWLPMMQNNKYNLIHFSDEQYKETAKLTITPEPESMLRVFMVYKGLDKYIEIPEQEIKPFERKGFAVIEWGGTEVK